MKLFLISIIVTLALLLPTKVNAAQRCVIYGEGHKIMIRTSVANVKTYYRGTYLRTISQPGTYRLGMSTFSNYTCK